ncbi:MAG TPA: DUF4350 domain-containing protein [Rhizomicrobium sp.]|nr:DUF4350 domain-containing protein [Rhizomicrobium sp.]
MSAAGEAPRTFSVRMVTALILISAFSLLAVMALSAYAPELRSQDNPQANAYSRSAIGYAGLMRLLEDCGVPVKIGREKPLRATTSQASLTILAPTLMNTAKQLRETGLPGARLFILPKWIALPDPLRDNWVMKGEPMGTKLIEQTVLEGLAKKSKLMRAKGNAPVTLYAPLPSFQPAFPNHSGKIDRLQTVSGGNLAGVVRDAKNNIVVAQVSGTQTYILSDPDFLNTQGIHDLATARAAVALIQQLRVGNGPVVFDVTLNGFGSSPDFFGLLFRPPFLGATICAFLTALLIGLHAISRFGTPPPPPPAYALGKQALAGNTADLIRVMGREPAMTRRYATVTRNLVLKSLGARRDLGPEQTNALLGGLERRLPSGMRFAEIAAESTQTNTRAHMLKVAQRLYHWRRGIMHER